jgi:hypothetical protein
LSGATDVGGESADVADTLCSLTDLGMSGNGGGGSSPFLNALKATTATRLRNDPPTPSPSLVSRVMSESFRH